MYQATKASYQIFVWLDTLTYEDHTHLLTSI